MSLWKYILLVFFVVAMILLNSDWIFGVNYQQVKIDASSDEALRSSIQQITDLVPEKKKQEFVLKWKLLLYTNSSSEFSNIISSNGQIKPSMKRFREKVDGKKAIEIERMGEEIMAKILSGEINDPRKFFDPESYKNEPLTKAY